MFPKGPGAGGGPSRSMVYLSTRARVHVCTWGLVGVGAKNQV